jgi:hypothetical protein
MAELSYNKLDEKLFAIYCKLPIFPFYKLVSPDKNHSLEQKNIFLKNNICPTFSYSQAMQFDVDGYLRALELAKKQMIEINSDKWILDLYLSKLDEQKERAQIINAIKEKNDKLVSELSKKLFCFDKIDRKTLEEELDQMINSNKKLHPHIKRINAQMFAKMVEAILNHYKIQNWKIKFSDESCVKLTRTRYAKHPVIRIPNNFLTTKARARRILTHEIEVHALRTQNATNSPLHILTLGLDHYISTEEGLALCFQQKISKCKTPGFWESYACALSQEMDFVGVFNTLLDARTKLDNAIGHNKSDIQRKNKIWNLCVRTYKGVYFPNQSKLGTCKDSIYRTGLSTISNINISDANIQKQLFAGKIGIQHLDITKNIDLSFVKTPNFVSKSASKNIYSTAKTPSRKANLFS